MLEFGTQEADIVYVDRPGVYAVLRLGDQFGIIETATEKFCLPGGGIDAGEDHHTALKREIMEETGYTAQIGPYVGVCVQYAYSVALQQHLRKICHYYQAEAIEKISENIDPCHTLIWMNYDGVREALGKYALGSSIWAYQQIKSPVL